MDFLLFPVNGSLPELYGVTGCGCLNFISVLQSAALNLANPLAACAVRKHVPVPMVRLPVSPQMTKLPHCSKVNSSNVQKNISTSAYIV